MWIRWRWIWQAIVFVSINICCESLRLQFCGDCIIFAFIQYMNIFASMNISTGIFEFTRYGVECDSYESENIWQNDWIGSNVFPKTVRTVHDGIWRPAVTFCTNVLLKLLQKMSDDCGACREMTDFGLKKWPISVWRKRHHNLRMATW